MLKEYYTLVKPGIVYGNAFTTLAAFLFASRWQLSPWLLCATLLGIALVIASACVCNNYIDRDIDQKMARTKSRALATGTIPVRNAILYAAVLGILGLILLYVYVNILTAAMALLGFIFYVALYSTMKHRSHWAAVVGSVAGAMPIVVGYTAVTNHLDITALILLLVLAFWQLPHFYAIAIYRLTEYSAAGIPVLPTQKGIRASKVHIVFYIAAYLVAACALTALGHAGYTYLACVLLFGLIWFWLGIKGFTTLNDAQWARKLFFFSLIVLVSFSAALSVAMVLP
jgi:protoheme IX farnesyltransferase